MSTFTNDPRLVRISTTIYSTILVGYPRLFRQEYGPHMRQVFRDACLNAYIRSGFPGLLSFWALTLFDWFKTVIEEQLNRATYMTRAKWVRLSGWSMMGGAVVMQLSFLIDANWIRARIYRVMGAPVSQAEYDLYGSIAERLETFPATAGILLIVLGISGLRQHYGKQLTGMWQGGFTVCVGGGLLTAAGALSLQFSDAAWDVLSIGLFLMFGTLAIFGVAAVRAGLLPGWSGIPLLACFWFPLFITLNQVNRWATGELWLELPHVFDWVFTLSFVSLFLLGYELQRGSEVRSSPTIGIGPVEDRHHRTGDHP